MSTNFTGWQLPTTQNFLLIRKQPSLPMPMEDWTTHRPTILQDLSFWSIHLTLANSSRLITFTLQFVPQQWHSLGCMTWMHPRKRIEDDSSRNMIIKQLGTTQNSTLAILIAHLVSLLCMAQVVRFHRIVLPKHFRCLNPSWADNGMFDLNQFRIYFEVSSADRFSIPSETPTVKYACWRQSSSKVLSEE